MAVGNQQNLQATAPCQKRADPRKVTQAPTPPALVTVRSCDPLTRRRETLRTKAKENPQLLCPSLFYLEQQMTRKSYEIMLVKAFCKLAQVL